jgi:TonB family protein
LTYALVISLVLHLLAFGYFLFGERRGAKDAYPRIMSVDLVSLPPISRGTPAGVETPGKSDAETVKPKPQTKVEQKPEEPRLAELEKRKKPSTKTKKKQPQSQAKEQKEEKKPAKGESPGIDKDKLGLPAGVEFGSEFGTAKLEGASFETPTYLNILFAKIKYRWDNPYEGSEKTTCTIYFVILRNGDIVDAAIEISSGIAAFDQSALRAVLSSKPPPLPLEYAGNQLGIHLEFQYLP